MWSGRGKILESGHLVTDEGDSLARKVVFHDHGEVCGSLKVDHAVLLSRGAIGGMRINAPDRADVAAGVAGEQRLGDMLGSDLSGPE